MVLVGLGCGYIGTGELGANYSVIRECGSINGARQIAPRLIQLLEKLLTPGQREGVLEGKWDILVRFPHYCHDLVDRRNS
jgi:hypothetical protein